MKELVKVITDLKESVSILISFLVSGVRFLINIITTIFNYLYKAFVSIFTDDLYSYLDQTFDYLTTYLGSTYTILFISLLGLVFLIIIFSFIMRVLRGRVGYNSALKHIDKQNRSRK